MSLGPEKAEAFLDLVYTWLLFCMVEVQLASVVDAGTKCVYRK